MKKQLSRSNLYSILSLVLFLATACDTKDTTPLPGKREAFLTFDSLLNEKVSRDKASGSAQKKIAALPTPFHQKACEALGCGTTASNNNWSFAKDPQKIWSTNVGVGVTDDARLTSPPVASATTVYTIDTNATVTALTRQERIVKDQNFAPGAVLWSQSALPQGGAAADAVTGSLTLEGNTLYVTTSYGDVIALDAATGKQKWRRSDFAPIRSAAVINNQHLYFQTTNNDLYALDKTTGTSVWTHNGVTESAQLYGGASPAIFEDSVIVAYTSGEIYALNTTTGAVLWSDIVTPAARIDTVSSIPHVVARPIIDKGSVYVVSHGGKMIALELKTGTRQWQTEIGGVYPPLVVGDAVFVISSQAELIALDRSSGHIVWLQQLSSAEAKDRPSFSGPIMANSRLWVGSTEGKLLSFDPYTGKSIDMIDTTYGISIPPIVADKEMCVLNDGAMLDVYR